MAPSRQCSEWGLVPTCLGALEGRGPKAITCSQPCRQHRARRRKAINDDPAARAAEAEVGSIVRREAPDVVHRIMKQELAPVVREAIDDDVVKAIGAMIGLTSQAVQVLERDLGGEDPVLAQRAAALVVKYTVGHPALVKAEEGSKERLTVVLTLPGPDAVPLPVDAEADVVEEDKACDICGESRPASEFVAGSDRCVSCFAEYRARILAEVGE